MPTIPAYDLSELISFLTVVEQGSISRAAAELHLTQPGVSQKIRSLEAALATRLLTRTSRGVRPTASGQLVADGIPPLLATLRGLEQSVRLAQAAEQVTLGSSDTAALYLLPDVIRRFRKRFPQCRLTLINRE